MNRSILNRAPLSCHGQWTQRLVATLAAHPYFCAWLVCLALTPLTFGAWEFVPANATLLVAVLALGCGCIALLHGRKRYGLPRWGVVLGAILLLGGVLLCAGFYHSATTEQKAIWILSGGGVLLLILCLLGCRNRQLRQQYLALFIFGISFLVKLLYVMTTSIYRRQHDMGQFNAEDGIGHAAYIQYLLETHAMPDFDPSWRWQFYHPPLHHAISAVWIGLLESVFGVGYDQARESLQMLTLFYAMAIVITGYRILRHFRLQGVSLYVPLLLLAFHPTFILFSGSVNNDALSVVFLAGAILSTLKWYRAPSWIGLGKIALCVGLGMMTKLSVALVAIPIAVVFLIVLVQKLRQRQWCILGQYAAFLGVCAPLGLWHPIRNYILFDLPLNYVQKVDPAAAQYLGDQNFLDRITDFSARQFADVFVQFASRDVAGHIIGTNENNPLICVLKNFLFGEFINENYFPLGSAVRTMAELFFWFSLVLAAIVLALTIWGLVRKCGMRPMEKLFLGLIYAVMMGSLYLLAAKEPFVCSMNSRYITPVLLVEATFLGVFLQWLQQKPRIAASMVRRASLILMEVFALLSSGVYLRVILIIE